MALELVLEIHHLRGDPVLRARLIVERDQRHPGRQVGMSWVSIEPVQVSDALVVFSETLNAKTEGGQSLHGALVPADVIRCLSLHSVAKPLEISLFFVKCQSVPELGGATERLRRRLPREPNCQADRVDA